MRSLIMTAGLQASVDARLLIASAIPNMYEREKKWGVAGSDTAANRRTLQSPDDLVVRIGAAGYFLNENNLDLNDSDSWDDLLVDWSDSDNRAGRDFYIYICPSAGSYEGRVILSASSMGPSGEGIYRLVGGFHCLCESVGMISGHDLSGFLTGDILPASVWDLKHRPYADPEGMLFDGNLGLWVDIYLNSAYNGELRSVYDEAVATGTTSEKFHWYKYAQWLGRIGKRMPYQHEFLAFAYGSNEGTNISGSVVPSGAGGHTDTAGRRMISDTGVEDCCGVYWQWGLDMVRSSSWGEGSAYDANDDGVVRGTASSASLQDQTLHHRIRMGGDYNNADTCGTRASIAGYGTLFLSAVGAVRGMSERL